MTWLVTGGAGYIGAHVIRELRNAGFPTVVVDDLSTGDASRLPADVPLVLASVLDEDEIAEVLQTFRVTGVVHLAAKKAVEESMLVPLRYWRENVGGTLSLLRAMSAAAVGQLVFSSTAAVYGEQSQMPVTEAAITNPANPYGETKLACERMIAGAGRAGRLDFVNLRYFNVAGCASPDLVDTSVENLIPLVLDALRDGRRPVIFGGDYPTADGSCVRDFIHVSDLAEAHVAAVFRLQQDGRCGEVVNIGSGRGYRVREVMAAAADVTGLPTDPVVGPRRAGDAPMIVAAIDLARTVLGWSPRRGLEEMLSGAWLAATQAQSAQT